MSWDYRFGGLILFTTLSDFLIGRYLGKEGSSESSRRFAITLSIGIDLGILFLFKYYSFFSANISGIAGTFGLDLSAPALQIILPAGISFYTFQSLSYTIDVYRRVISPEKSLLNYALFLSFFPQLVAGPIVTAKEFLPQIKALFLQKFADIPLQKACYFIAIGLIKKSVLADNVATIVDPIFGHDHLELISWKFLTISAIGYSLQIYCDFSGYSDIAYGVALLLGFTLPENFNLPYFSSSLTDFWKRWHISLSGWLKSYLYIPLGGNKEGLWKTYRNLFITMLLGGLWHGASWNFVIWGGLHGIYLAIERAFKSISDVRPNRLILKILYSLFIFLFVTILWVFFRAKDFQTASMILSGIFTLKPGADPNPFHYDTFNLVFSTVLLGHIVGYFFKEKREVILEKMSLPATAFLYSIVFTAIILLSGDTKPFIYFVF